MVIIDRVTPSEIIVVVRCVIDGPVVKVEIGVPVPWTPPVSRCVALNHSNFWLSTIRGDLKIFYVNLFAAFSDDVKFHPSVFDMTDGGDLNVFGAVFCSKDKGVAITCLFSVFVVVSATCRLAFGIADPCSTCDGFFVIFDFESMRFPSVSDQNFNILCSCWNFKKIYRAGNCEFVVICVLSFICPSGESDTVLKSGAGGNRCVPAFYPFINITCDAMLTTQPVCVIIVVCIHRGCQPSDYKTANEAYCA